MQAVSRNDRPLIVTSLEFTTMRESPVSMAAPGCPVSDVSVSALPTVRTASP